MVSMKKDKRTQKKQLDSNEPAADVLNSNCPSRQVLNNVTSKWGVLVFYALSDRKVKRFSEIRREIDGVSEKMLTQTLKSLEADGFVTRKSYNVVPPYVEYSLTDTGREASLKIIGLIKWIENNLNRIK